MKIALTEPTTNLQNLVIDTAVEVHHVTVIHIVKLHDKIDIALTLETDTDMTELLLLHTLTDLDMTIIDKIHVLIAHHTDLLIDHHLDEIHILDIDHILILEIDRQFPQYTSSYRSLSQPRESRPFRSRSNEQQKLKSIPIKQNNPIHLLILKSLCTTLQNWRNG